VKRDGEREKEITRDACARVTEKVAEARESKREGTIGERTRGKARGRDGGGREGGRE